MKYMGLSYVYIFRWSHFITFVESIYFAIIYPYIPCLYDDECRRHRQEEISTRVGTEAMKFLASSLTGAIIVCDQTLGFVVGPLYLPTVRNACHAFYPS